MSRTKSTILFVIGILFLLFGLFLYLTWWFFLYGMIAVVIGAVLVLMTSKPWLVKGLVAGVPVLFVAWSFSQSFASAQTFLIPQSYSGPFIVIEGEPCGTADEKVNGRYEVYVPSNGIAVLQREQEGGWVDDEYYFIDEAGRRTPIVASTGLPRDAVTTPSVMLGGSGSVAGTLPDGRISTEAEGAIHYTTYFVITPDSNSFQNESALDDLMIAQVDSCRQGR